MLKYHLICQLTITTSFAFIISSFTDLNIGAFTISKVIFELLMGLVYYLTQNEIDWSEKALLARSRMEKDLPPEFTPGRGRISPIEKNSGGKRESLNQDDVKELMAYGIGPSNNQNYCADPICSPSPRGTLFSQIYGK